MGVTREIIAAEIEMQTLQDYSNRQLQTVPTNTSNANKLCINFVVAV